MGSIPIPCDANPCQNGGTCVNDADYSGYTCDCTADYFNYQALTDCETLRPCAGDPCQNGAACVDDLVNMLFECFCDGDYVGSLCQYQPRCVVDPCLNGAGCIETDLVTYATRTCVCADGWSGTDCDIADATTMGPMTATT